MEKILLYHGSPNESVVPTYGLGKERHDYGKGFYLTEDLDLAKEWAVCRPEESKGYVHSFELDLTGLKSLDFTKVGILSWLAELMKHRPAGQSKRYRLLADKFIDRYGVETEPYDILKGWRANASYFYIAKEFVRDNADIDILEELLSLGNLGTQYCLKSAKSFDHISELNDSLIVVHYTEFNSKYTKRDVEARNNIRSLIDSERNKVTKVFSTILEDNS